MEEDELLTTKQAAELLKVSPITLCMWRASASHLPFVRVGRFVRYRKADINAWLDKNTENGKPA